METYVWLDKSWRGRRNGQMSRQLLRPKESAQDDDEDTKKTQKYRQTENRVEFPLTADFPSPCPIQIATPSSK